MNHRTGSRLKVTVRIDSDLRSARIAVLGFVTPVNLLALSVIARRTIALLPGTEITVDLSRASAASAAIEALGDPGQLVRLAGERHDPLPHCTLRILNPLAATATQEHK